MNPTLRHAAVTTAALVALSGLTACGSSAGAPSATKSSAAASASPSADTSMKPMQSMTSNKSMSSMIMITDFTFQAPASVAPGSDVTVMNTDAEAHTVTADGAGGFDVKVDPGKTVTFKAPPAAGTYKFHCAYHSSMRGSLRVG